MHRMAAIRGENSGTKAQGSVTYLLDLIDGVEDLHSRVDSVLKGAYCSHCTAIAGGHTVPHPCATVKALRYIK